MATVSNTPTSSPVTDDYDVGDCPELKFPSEDIHRIGMPAPQNNTEKVIIFGDVGVATPTVAFSASVFFGVLALVVFYRITERKRDIIFYRLLSAMLWTDLLSAAAVGSAPVGTAVTGTWLLRDIEMYCDGHSVTVLFNWYVVSFLLALMSLERYLAIRRPAVYAVRMERHKVKWMVGISWVLAAFVAILPAVGFGNNVIHYPGTWCFFDWFSRDTSQRLYASLFVATVLGVMIGVTGSTASVGITIKIRQRERRNSVAEIKPERRKGPGEGHAAVEMVLLLTAFICVFIACWTPLIMKILVDTLEQSARRDNSMELIAFRLAMARFSINPIVFILSRAPIIRKHCCIRGDGGSGDPSAIVVCSADGRSAPPPAEESCCDSCCSPMRWARDGEADSRFSYFSSGRTVYGGELSAVSGQGQNSTDANNTDSVPPSTLEIHREVSIPGSNSSPRVPKRDRHSMEVTVNV